MTTTVAAGLPAEEMTALLASLTNAPEAAGYVVDPRPPCVECGKPLDAAYADVRLHPGCDTYPFNRDHPTPPSTIRDLSTVLLHFEERTTRSLQTTLGPSEIATPCDRRLAYGLMGVPKRPDSRVPWAAGIGTAVHARIAEALAVDNRRLGRQRWLIEQVVYPDPGGGPGTCDAYDVDTDMVIDWKVVGASSLARYAKSGPGAQYEGQIHLYGRGWQRAGRTPLWVRIVFLPRASYRIDDAFEWTAPYDWRKAEEVLDRMYAIAQRAASLDLGEHPQRWDDIDALPGRLCNYCPYHRRGKPADGTGCPGDVAADERAMERLTAGIIVP